MFLRNLCKKTQLDVMQLLSFTINIDYVNQQKRSRQAEKIIMELF